MNSSIVRKKKRTVVVTTMHALCWLWVSAALERKFSPHSPIWLAAGIAFIVALWIAYRAVLALRRAEKKEAEHMLPHDGARLS